MKSGCLFLMYLTIISSFIMNSTYAEEGDSSNRAQASAIIKPSDSKLGSILQQLLPNSSSESARSLNDFSKKSSKDSAATLRSAPPVAVDGYIVIDAVADNDNAELLEKKLVEMGMLNAGRFGRMVSGRFPVEKLSELEGETTLRFARHSFAIKNVGQVTSQGDEAMRSEMAKNDFGVSGTGVAVGVLSDSYDCLGGAASGVFSGDLPPDVSVLEEYPCDDSTIDEGRGMMEIVHDVAPDASLMFHTAFLGQANFANGIVALAENGAKVIVDDIRYFAQPFFQDGVIAQAVDQVNREKDVTYFSSAGNQGRESYESEYREKSVSGFGLFNFAAPDKPEDVCLEVTVPGGSQALPVLQWDDDFFSVGGKGATANLGMFLVNTCNLELERFLFDGPYFQSVTESFSSNDNIGGDPIEGTFVPFGRVIAEDTTFGVVILRSGATLPGRIKLMANGASITDINKTDSSTSYGHAVAKGAMGVGASFFLNTPAFDVSPAVINAVNLPEGSNAIDLPVAYDSSAGGTQILFDTEGNRLAYPEIRKQPAIVGPDGTSNTFFGTQFDGLSYPLFFGTSASAPHLAGVAALMRSHNPYASADDVYKVLTDTAEDMDDPLTEIFDIGYDTGTGYGFVNAQAAISGITPPAEWYCDGKLATIIGTNNSETLNGTSDNDVIVGLNGNDQINGKGGNDIICGGNGKDKINSGHGDDKVFGGNGQDKIWGISGQNILYGENGSDRILGGKGDDIIYGGNGRDYLYGQKGRDVIYGGKGFDRALGGLGYDSCSAEYESSCEY